MEKLKKYIGFIVIVAVALVLLFFLAYPKIFTQPQVKLEEVKTSASSQGKLEVSSPCEGASTPVCGEDKKTYASECLAQYLGVKIASQGVCPKEVSQ